MGKVKGREKLKRRLRAIPKAVRDETAKALLTNALILEAKQRQWVPVDDGDLRDAHGVKFFKDTLRTINFVDLIYASFVELGRAGAPANPWFFPAYRVLRTRMKARLTRGMKKGIKRALGKS